MDERQPADEILYGAAPYSGRRQAVWRHQRLAAISPVDCWQRLGEIAGDPGRGESPTLPRPVAEHRLLWISPRPAGGGAFRHAVTVGVRRSVEDAERHPESLRALSFFTLEFRQAGLDGELDLCPSPRREWHTLTGAVIGVSAQLLSRIPDRSGSSDPPWPIRAPFIIDVSDQILSRLG